MSFSAREYTKGHWEIWEHIPGCKRQVCVMSTNDILELFNGTVPRVVEEPYLKGDLTCKHSWRPWKFNDSFMICANCPAMQKIKKLVPKEYN
jgi:hypothetical protein